MLTVVRGEREPSLARPGAVLAALSPEAGADGRDPARAPASIAEAVRLTGRAQPNVSRSYQQLARYGLVRLVRVGREVRPGALVRELRVDLVDGTYRTEGVE